MTAMKPALRYSLVMGALCAPVGVGVGWNVAETATGSGYEYFFAYAAVSAFAIAALAWWLIVERRAKLTIARGATAGLLAGIFAHWLCWYLIIFAANLCNWTTGGCTSS